MTNTAKDTREKLLLNKCEAAAQLSISVRKLWSITMPRGPIPCVKIGSRCLYPVEGLRRYVAENTVVPPAPISDADERPER